MLDLHRAELEWDGDPDRETDDLVRDLLAVWNTVHQGMVVYGPWFEARMLHLVRQWLPEGFNASGPAQVFDPARPGIRSRSWDIVVHRYPLSGVPPESAPGNGYPLLPIDEVAAVIDTKTNFSSPTKYAAGTIFNLMNDAQSLQSQFFGPRISRILLVVTSSKSPGTMADEGARHGLQTFSLGRYFASPVADAEQRRLRWRMQAYRDGSYPFQAFKSAIAEAVKAMV